MTSLGTTADQVGVEPVHVLVALVVLGDNLLAVDMERRHSEQARKSL
jgi:hypothetical protein